MAASPEEHVSGIADAAGRAALYPARAAARVWRAQLESAVDDVLSAPEIARVLDRALAGSLPEEIAHSVVRHRVVERVVAELAASGELDRLLSAALASPRTLELTDRVLASDEAQHALGQIAASPEIREAIARQTAGFAEELMGGVRAGAAQLDDRVEHAVRRRPREVHPPFGGLVTRALALACDALVTILLYMAVVGVVSIVGSLVGGLKPEWLVGVLLGAGWILMAGTYFVVCWSATGQTPGMRLLRLRVQVSAGGAPSVGRSIVRLFGLVLAIIPVFLGFVPVLFDRRRRGLADFMAGTVVVYTDA